MALRNEGVEEEGEYFSSGPGSSVRISCVESAGSVLTCCGCLPVPCNANEVDEPMTQKAQCDMPPCVCGPLKFSIDSSREGCC